MKGIEKIICPILNVSETGRVIENMLKIITHML
jgi:hypothetical protein